MELCDECGRRVARRMRESERRIGERNGRGVLIQKDGGDFIVKAMDFSPEQWPELEN